MAPQLSSTRSRPHPGARNSPARSASLVPDLRNAPNLIARALLFAGLLFETMSANAVDGCLVLLCLAAPSWSSIAQCVDPVRQVLRDLARGRPFPSCAMAGAGNTAQQQWASPPDFCPPQYTITIEQ